MGKVKSFLSPEESIVLEKDVALKAEFLYKWMIIGRIFTIKATKIDFVDYHENIP